MCSLRQIPAMWKFLVIAALLAAPAVAVVPKKAHRGLQKCLQLWLWFDCVFSVCLKEPHHMLQIQQLDLRVAVAKLLYLSLSLYIYIYIYIKSGRETPERCNWNHHCGLVAQS